MKIRIKQVRIIARTKSEQERKLKGKNENWNEKQEFFQN